MLPSSQSVIQRLQTAIEQKQQEINQRRGALNKAVDEMVLLQADLAKLQAPVGAHRTGFTLASTIWWVLAGEPLSTTEIAKRVTQLGYRPKHKLRSMRVIDGKSVPRTGALVNMIGNVMRQKKDIFKWLSKEQKWTRNG